MTPFTREVAARALLVAEDVTELMGSTPMLHLHRVVPAGAADIYAKLEFFNPGGSVKDRAALGMTELGDFIEEAQQALLWTRQQLTAESRQFLQVRPERVVPDAEFTLVHASPREPSWEYITNTYEARDNFPYFATPVCLVGHTHVPIMYWLDDKRRVNQAAPKSGALIHLRGGPRFIVNPGSVGQPRDSDPRASYTVFDTESGTLSFQRVGYDIHTTQERMAQARLPLKLITRLDYGS